MFIKAKPFRRRSEENVRTHSHEAKGKVASNLRQILLFSNPGKFIGFNVSVILDGS